MILPDIFSTEATLAALTADDGAAIALSNSGERVLGATEIGKQVFGAGTDSLPRLVSEQMARLASQVSSGSPRLVRLRLGGLRPVTVRAQRVRLADGTGALVLVALDAPRPRRSEPAAQPEASPLPEAHLSEQPSAEVEAETPATVDDQAEPIDTEAVATPLQAAHAGIDAEPSNAAPPPVDIEISPQIPEQEATEAPVDTPDVAPEISAPASEPPAKRPLRFVWQTDETGALGLVSPEFATAVKHDADSLVGRKWTDLASEIGFDSEGKLHRALGRRDTWSGVTIDWPLDNGHILAVDLAGLPVFDRERNFKGFRGFGVCHEPQAIPEPAVGNVAEPVAPPPPPATTVVPFPEPREPGRPPLSNSDRHALREIARALGSPAPDKVISVASRRAPAPVKPTPTEAGAPPAQPPSPAPSTAPAAASPLPAAASEPELAPAPAPVADNAPDSRATLVDALPYAVLVHRAGVPIYANRAFTDLSGYADLDVLARAGVDALFGDEPAPDEAALPPGSMRIRRADGLALPVECHLKQISWQDDPATLLTFRVSEPAPLAAEPVSASPADTPAMAEMARQVRELTAILDTATDGVVVLDADGRILSINRSAEALFGYESVELSGRSLTLLLSTESHNAALDYLDGMRANGVASLLNDGREVIGIARRGGSIPLFMTLGRLDDDAGAKFCAVLRDITQFKKAEEELRASKTHAESTSAQKSDFLARISHEIRTPLNAILGFAEVMMEERFGPIGTERYRDYLRDIHTSGQHVISLVNDLLDLSKIEAGRLDLAFTSLQLNDVVTTAVGLMQPQANTSRVIVRTSLAAKLPAVVADERSLRQIALNLLSNAIKFTPAGGQVIISTALTDLGQAVIRVRDTGIGMTDKDIQAALEPFRQIASSGRGDGTGLGLPLTKALTEANRATFAIQSATGSGTLVEVIFPPTRVLAE